MATPGGLVIDWTQMPTYNTIMSLAAGAALLSLASLGRDLQQRKAIHPEAWALNFGVLGFLLTLTGAHMTLTWPFAKYFPFDNIIFEEPSLAFGVLLLGMALYLWKRAERFREPADPLAEIVAVARPLSIFIVGLGLSLVAIACAGIAFRLFAAPPEEPISGRFAAYPWVEAVFMSGLFGLVGVAALLAPLTLRQLSSGRPAAPSGLSRLLGVVTALAGLAFLLFGALNYYTHIGLIIRTNGTTVRGCGASTGCQVAWATEKSTGLPPQLETPTADHDQRAVE